MRPLMQGDTFGAGDQWLPPAGARLYLILQEGVPMVTLQEIKQNEAIRALIKAGNRYLDSMGYTEHGPRHVGYVSKTANSTSRGE